MITSINKERFFNAFEAEDYGLMYVTETGELAAVVVSPKGEKLVIVFSPNNLSSTFSDPYRCRIRLRRMRPKEAFEINGDF